MGVLAVFYPEVVGNGQALITGLVDEDYSTQQAFILLLVKVSAVAIVFGCGTVGGAMTPTLYVGSMVGFIFSTVLTSLGMEGNHTVAYAMVGMAAFFAVAAQAPLTALVMVVEFSMSGEMIYPLLIGVVSAYGTGRLIRARSMYAASSASNAPLPWYKSLGNVNLCIRNTSLIIIVCLLIYFYHNTIIYKR